MDKTLDELLKPDYTTLLKDIIWATELSYKREEGNKTMNTSNNNQLQTFEHEVLGAIRVISQEGEPWFVGKDVAELLGYSNIKMAVNRKVDDEDKGVSVLDTPGGKQPITIINESGLYSLILSSKLPAAKAFKRWVTSEVLPTIRKHGMYMTDHVAAAAIEDPTVFLAKALLMADEVMKKQAETIRNQATIMDKQQLHIKELKTKATKYDKSMSTEKTFTVSDTALMVGLSGTQLYNLLVNLGWLHKDHLKAYQLAKGAPAGVFEVVKTHFSNKSTQLRVTAYGVTVIRQLPINNK